MRKTFLLIISIFLFSSVFSESWALTPSAGLLPSAVQTSVMGMAAKAQNNPVDSAGLPSGQSFGADIIEKKDVFGYNLFNGKFKREKFKGFNPNYLIMPDDNIQLRVWGAVNLDMVVQVDQQGNIFIPGIGPVKVAGIKNSDLNAYVDESVKKVFKSSIGVYTSLVASQPVQVYVSGSVNFPGLYSGLSSDSVLYYIDNAGGIDLDGGSFRDITVLRNNQVRFQYDLYEFLQQGKMRMLQMQDGDMVFVAKKKHSIKISGEVQDPFVYEFTENTVPLKKLLEVAGLKPTATHATVSRKVGIEWRSEYFALNNIDDVLINDGDEVVVTADKYVGTMIIRIEGAHLGKHVLVVPRGTKLKTAVKEIVPSENADTDTILFFRKSVAQRQKEMLLASLKALEASVLTANSATNEEAQLRVSEANLIMQFIEKAKNVEPKGQIIIDDINVAGEMVLEDGDVIALQEKSSVVMVHGEVLFPSTVVFSPDYSFNDYISKCGGYLQKESKSKVLVLHRNGSFSEKTEEKIIPGDEIMVLPMVQTKSVEVTRGITQILYQIAVTTKVLLGL